MLTAKQLERRRDYLTASRVPAAIGVSPWASPADVYLEYTEGLRAEENDAMRLGTMAEPLLIAWARQRMGVKTRANQWRVADERASFMGATLDAVVVGTDQHMEAKFTQRPGEEWGAELTDQIPPPVIIQTQAQMFCAGTARVWVPAWLGFRGPVLFQVDRDDELINEVIIPQCREFWSCVQDRRMPEGAPPSLELLKQRERRPGKVATDCEYLVDQWAAVRAAKLAGEKADKAALEQLLAAMGDAEAAVSEYGTMTYLEQQRTDIDAKRLRAELPEVAAKYERRSTYRTARWKPNKEDAA